MNLKAKKPMIDTNRQPFVIISANTDNQSVVDAFKQSYALKFFLSIRKLPFKVVSGKFDGKIEISFLITGTHDLVAKQIANIFKQKCFLAVDRYREAKLVYTDNSPSRALGYFLEGQSEDNYTIHNGVKYVCSGA